MNGFYVVCGSPPHGQVRSRVDIAPFTAPWRGGTSSPLDDRVGSGRLRRVRHLWSPPPLIEYIAADVVNNCNLRCPFCLVDYDQVKHTQRMDERTFRALIRLAPAVPRRGFWLSCLHEPTLHPRLAEYLSWISVEQRRKFWVHDEPRAAAARCADRGAGALGAAPHQTCRWIRSTSTS